MPGLAITPFIPSAQPDPNAGGSWFGGLGDIFSWGGGNDPPPIPGPNRVLPPPNISQMPQLPPNPSGTSTAWGGPEVMPNAAAAPDISSDMGSGTYGTMPEGEKKFSFMDNPGASDALVAFGAAMLKAPTFNQGLGDAALAVNQVAQKYRMPTEADYARAKQLGMIRQIASGKATTPGGIAVDRSNLYRDADGNTWFDATGPNGEAGLYNQDTGQFSTGGVPGLTRDVYDYGMNRNRRSGSKDADIESDFVEKIPGIASTAAQFDQLYKLASDDTTGIDSSFSTRVARQLTTLSPEIGQYFTGLDPNNITEFNNRLQNAALQYASNSFKGQGQVTENEREMINRAVGQPGTLTKQSAMLVFKIMRDAEIRKLKMYQEWSRNPDIRETYQNSFSRYQAEVLTNATLEQIQGGTAPSGSAPQPSAGGSTQSGINWSVTE
jgi:hypothetical protein